MIITEFYRKHLINLSTFILDREKQYLDCPDECNSEEQLTYEQWLNQLLINIEENKQ